MHVADVAEAARPGEAWDAEAGQLADAAVHEEEAEQDSVGAPRRTGDAHDADLYERDVHGWRRDRARRALQLDEAPPRPNLNSQLSAASSFSAGLAAKLGQCAPAWCPSAVHRAIASWQEAPSQRDVRGRDTQRHLPNAFVFLVTGLFVGGVVLFVGYMRGRCPSREKWEFEPEFVCNNTRPLLHSPELSPLSSFALLSINCRLRPPLDDAFKRTLCCAKVHVEFTTEDSSLRDFDGSITRFPASVTVDSVVELSAKQVCLPPGWREPVRGALPGSLAQCCSAGG